ncbi:hypothetical protein PLESTB_000495300 [Pleodorina starrii]|uniref:RAP domain-containing protein n=1 Tax=Pleodorina starrii TaxID=330485 RepID=A0A9W6EZS6_9CHLO|nr:hypothetical protein PLESTB_000495300 [Pleodorina starrii]
MRPSSAADADERWGHRRGSGQQNWDSSRAGGRPSDERGSGGDHAFQRREPRPQNRYQGQNRGQHHDAAASSGANWVGKGRGEGMYDLETELMGDAFGGLDPGEADTGTSPSAGDDAWSEHVGDSGDSDGSQRFPAAPTATVLTLAQLEEASREAHSWSLERLAEAATAMCHLRSAGAGSAGLEPGSDISPFNRREEVVMDAIATAVIFSARRGGGGGAAAAPGVSPAVAAAQRGWAVAQLLWACARGQYWAGPPKPRPGATWPAATAAAAGPGAAAAEDQGLAAAGTKSWPSPAEVRSLGASAAAAEALGALAIEPRQANGAADGNSGGGAAADGNGPAAATTARNSHPTEPPPANGSITAAAIGCWRPLAVELLGWLAADGCRLVSQLDSRSLSLVWWALAKAAAAARAKHSSTHLPPLAAAAASAAADVLAAATPALIASLDARAIQELGQKNNAKLCALLYSCACVNKSCDRLLRALGDELAARLERALILGDAGAVAGVPRGGGVAAIGGRFSSRELSCIAYSCGLLGLRHEKLMAALSEYATTCPHAKWSASAISVFMYGIANTGHRDQRLMSWADAAISSKPAIDFNLRNISFLLYNFHRLRWWPARAAEHLLSATRLHAPPSIPLISISTILMCMGSGRARDERSLAHLCQALTRRPGGQLSCKDICICLTALQRLHGEDVLASQQPEVLAALDHLVGAVVERGFSRVTPACRAVPVFNHQEVSNAMFALGKLKYYSPAVLETLRDHAARGGLEGASAWDCTAILVGLAQLNYRGSGGEDGKRGAGAAGSGGGEEEAAKVDLVEALADTVARRARTAKSQDLANTLWSLTVLEGALERYKSVVTTLLEEVNRRGPSSRNPDGFNVDEQRQLWQVHRELNALPEPYASLREDLVRLGKLGMSEADHTYSRVQASFQSLLNAMHTSGRYPRLRDLLFEQELVPGGEQLMRIDVQAMIERPKPGGGTALHRVAVEFDGPFHFMVNEPYTARIDGRTALRNRILTRHLGKENLVCVSMAEWVAASREPPTGLPGRWRLMAAKMGL